MAKYATSRIAAPESRSFDNSVEGRVLGHEPTVGDFDKLTISEQARVLYWYRYLYDQVAAATWLAQYANEVEDHFNEVAADVNFQIAVFARMSTNGAIIGSQRVQKIRDHLAELEAKLVAPRVTNGNVVSIAEKVRNSTNHMIAAIDELLDAATKKQIEVDISSFRVAIKTPHARILLRHYQPQLQELVLAANKADDQIIEGYSHLSSSELSCAIKRLQSIVTQIKLFAGGKVEVDLPAVVTVRTSVNNVEEIPQPDRKRVVRHKRPKSIGKLVSRVKYAQSSEEFGIQSLKAETIVGKTVAITFNAKYKQITMYVANAGERLSFRGGSLINVDIDKSSIKRVGRQTAEILKSFIEANGGKRAITSAFNALAGSRTEPRTAINENVLFIAVAG